MLIHIKTFNGHTLNDADYRTILLSPHSKPNAKMVFIEQTNADAVDAGLFTVDILTRVLSVEIRNYGSRVALAAQLKHWCKPGTRGLLVATFSDESRDYQLDARVVNVVQDAEHPLRWTIVLQSSITLWRSVSAETDTWTATGTGGTKSITVAGKDRTRLSVTFTGSVAPITGYYYQKLYRLPNVPAINFGRIPWCLTIDHAALVTAGKSLASGYDLRIFNGDTETKRWLSGANTSSCNIWFNVTMSTGYALKLKTGFSNVATITRMDFLQDTTHKTLFAALPASGVIYHGTEWFAYTAKDAVNCTLTISTRGLYGTTKQAHVANDIFYYIQNPLRLVYGNSSATDPALDDTNYDADKPMFSLSSSDNTKWVYTAAEKFYDSAYPSRTGQWLRAEQKLGSVSKLYEVKEDAASGDPALGIKAGTYQVGAIYYADTVTLSWTLYHAAGLSKITATGRKYRNSLKWFAFTGAQHSALGTTTWTTLWTETTPSTTTWESWASHSAIGIANTSKYVRIAATGVFPLLAGSYGMTEALTATVEFYSTNLPTGSLLSEAGNYPMDFTLTNSTTGDSLRLKFPAIYNVPFALNGEEFTALFDGANAYGALTLDDEGRDVWLSLDPGINSLVISAVDVGTLAVALSWYPRRQ